MNKNLILTRESAIILGAALVLGLSYNAFSPKPLPLVRTETTVVASDSLITALTATVPSTTPAAPVSQEAPPTQSVGREQQAQEKNTTSKQGTTKEPVKSTTQPTKAATPQTQQEAPPQEQAPKPAAPAKALEIRFDQVEKLLTNPDIMLIDARPAREFEAGHIGNAINIYTPEFEQNIGRIIGIPRDKPIIAYCGGGACELSHELAENLVKMGFTRVFVYVGGWNEWKQKKP